MALRTKEVEVGGVKYRIANSTFRAQRDYHERANQPETGPLVTIEAMIDFVLASVRRAGGMEVSRNELVDLDGEDIVDLFRAVMAWTGERQPPAGETQSP